MKFSDVAEAYNANVRNLDEARICFEDEARSLIQTVAIYLNAEMKKLNSVSEFKEKRYWNSADVASSKVSQPLGFYSEAQVNLSIRPVKAKNFKNKAAQIAFQVSYDEEISGFALKGIFTNTNEVADYLDEKVAEIASGHLANLPEAYKHSEVHKTKEYVAFKAPLNNEIWSTYGKLVTEFLLICDKAVAAFYQAEEAALAAAVVPPATDPTKIGA